MSLVSARRRSSGCGRRERGMGPESQHFSFLIKDAHMKTESIEYKDGDVTLRGFLAYDDAQSGRRPGVLVMPGGFGLGANAKGRSEMLARLGYVALAGDPYGGGIEVDELKEVMKLVTELRAD